MKTINEVNILELLEEMQGKVIMMKHLEVETYQEPSKTLSVGFNNAVERFVALIKEYQSELDQPTSQSHQEKEVDQALKVSKAIQQH